MTQPSSASQLTFNFNSGIIPTPISTTSNNPNEIDMAQGAGFSASAACVATNTCFTPNTG